MPKCFVVMGFGKKTDFTQNKTFDLDKSYQYIIKPAVDALFGQGFKKESARVFDALRQMQPPPESWMIKSTEEQLAKLKTLLER